jgi:hypothetical protein
MMQLCVGVATVVLCAGANAAPLTFFSNLGPPGNVYNCCAGWVVSGSGYVGTSYTQASLFTSQGTGNVSEIDLGVTYVDGQNSFYAALYTDNHGQPGTELQRWNNLSSSQHIGGCCALVSITGITGLSLTAGTRYFLVLGPMSVTDSSFLTWNLNTVNLGGAELISTDGGTSWVTTGSTNLSGAFDILGQ